MPIKILEKNNVFLFLRLLSATLLLLSISNVVFSEKFDDSKIMHVDYPDWFIDSTFLDFPDDLENAIANGKKGLMVLFTTQGCSYCDMFIRTSLGDPEISRLVQRNFDSVGLDKISKVCKGFII